MEDESGGVQIRHPDVRVFEAGRWTSQPPRPWRQRGAEPTRIVAYVASEPATESYVEIVDAQTRSRVVTCIELVSPTNKRPGQGLDVYLQKQAECRAGRVNLVEIDLTRGGRREEIFPWWTGGQPLRSTLRA